MEATEKEILDFYINKHTLDELNSILNKFNPLKVLGVQDYETKHSNVLAWLFDVKGHHGFRDGFFKKVLCEVLKNGIKDKNDRKPHINEVIANDYSDLETKREWHNIDLLCISEKNKTVFLVENKWSASESETQLNKYYTDITDDPRFSSKDNWKFVFVFLSINGEIPKGSDKYTILTHEQIYNILKSTVEINKDFMNKKVFDFLKNYLDILEEHAVPDIDPKLVELCKTLYKENKNAIETIIELGKPRLSLENIKAFHDKTKTQSCTEKTKSTVYYGFIPNTCVDELKKQNERIRDDNFRIYFSFDFSNMDYSKNKRVILRLDIGEFSQKDERTWFMEFVKKELADRKIVTKNFTNRIESVSIPIESEIAEDYEKIVEKMVDSYDKNMKKYEDVMLKAIEKFQSQCICNVSEPDEQAITEN